MHIMKTCSLAGLALLLLLSAGSVFAAPQTTCPVMGGDINKEVYADHEGKRVYFCCASCVAQFEKDPEKYLAKLKETGQEPEKLEQEEKKEPSEKEEADKEDHKDHHKE
jgi:YHS domain-containing protein